MIQLLEKIHHKVQHVGKTPAHANRGITIQKEVNQLRQELTTAIESEEYEKAAEIRDKIYNLEGRLKNPK